MEHLSNETTVHSETISLEDTHCFSRFFLDYIQGEADLAAFYNLPPHIGSVPELISQRNFDLHKRDVLSHVLSEQYEAYTLPEKLTENILSLKSENTFTITTGHQLNIFTGPLYLIYKLVSTINTCRSLKEKYPDYHFVPVYWMASEDHDFEEISYFFMGKEKVEWQTDQTGAVGRFDPSGLKAIAEKLPEGFEFFKDAYSKDTLAEAVRSYIHHLFGNEGLVVLDADAPSLKGLFGEVIKKDVLESACYQSIRQATERLETLGYKPQVTPRDINFFYLENGVRGRIEKDGERYQVVDTDLSFSREDVAHLIEAHPERFSPNVCLRPLYQETILPNLAYIGGPAEMVYWLQLKALFDQEQTPFPMLLPRNYALVVPAHLLERWKKLNLPLKDVFLANEHILEKWVKQSVNHALSYADEIETLKTLLDSSTAKAATIDPTLTKHLTALKVSFANKLEKAEKKLVRAEKRKHEEKQQQIQTIKDELFPNGTLQERKLNVIPFMQQQPAFIDQLLETFDPFNFEMYLMLQ